MLMHKILQNHLLCAFVANLKIGAIYALYPESFCDKNLAIRKVFAFCDSGLLKLISSLGLAKADQLLDFWDWRDDRGEREVCSSRERTQRIQVPTGLGH